MNKTQTKSMSELQQLFNSLMIQNYGSSKTIKLPFFGGYLQLSMEYTDGMIRLFGTKAIHLGDALESDLKLGYTCPVGLARSVKHALDKLESQSV